MAKCTNLTQQKQKKSKENAHLARCRSSPSTISYDEKKKTGMHKRQRETIATNSGRPRKQPSGSRFSEQLEPFFFVLQILLLLPILASIAFLHNLIRKEINLFVCDLWIVCGLTTKEMYQRMKKKRQNYATDLVQARPAFFLSYQVICLSFFFCV